MSNVIDARRHVSDRLARNVYLERWQVEALEQMAREQDRSTSQVLRELLTKTLVPHWKQSGG
jgi:hypothetical protein